MRIFTSRENKTEMSKIKQYAVDKIIMAITYNGSY